MNTMICTRCDGTGFLNLHQVDMNTLDRFYAEYDFRIIFDWMKDNLSDVQLCDCCGDGEGWYYMPGLHHISEIPDCI